jgi:hypothetical protein
MRTALSLLCLGVSALALGFSAVSLAAAQETGGYDAGRSAGTGPKCPAVEWHVAPPPRNGPATIEGVAYTADMKGVSIIKANRSADGVISGTVTSIYGTGPQGTITGKRDRNTTHVQLAGEGCNNFKFDLQRYAPVIGGD